MPRRVVLTGIGSVSSLGLGWGSMWNALCEGRTGLGPSKRMDLSGFESKLVGEVPDFKTQDYVPKSYRKAVKVMARDIELAVVAAKLAVEDAGLVTRSMIEATPGAAMTYASPRMGCHIGAGLIAADSEEIAAAMHTARLQVVGATNNVLDLKLWGGSGTDGGAGTGMEQLTPLWLLKYLPNMLACHVTIIHGCEGPSNTITCGEASGLLCVGESARVIERGAADLCFSGGVESKLNPMGMLRAHFAGLTATTGDDQDPAKFTRPFDPASQGGLLAEGGGVLILEEAECARARGARVYAEIAGVGGGTSDRSYSQGESDEGYRYAILNALDDAGIGPDQIDAVVPMASGAPRLDRAEAGAVRSVLGARFAQVPVVAISPNLGNCIAGHAALQVAAAAGCLHQQRLPARPQGGPSSLWPATGTPSRPDKSPAPLNYVLVCTGSIGGQNAAVVLKRAT